MLTPPKLVVNRRPGAKFLSNTNPQCAGFGAGGDVTGKSQAGEFPRPEKRKIASLTPDLVLDLVLWVMPSQVSLMQQLVPFASSNESEESC